MRKPDDVPLRDVAATLKRLLEIATRARLLRDSAKRDVLRAEFSSLVDDLRVVDALELDERPNELGTAVRNVIQVCDAAPDDASRFALSEEILRNALLARRDTLSGNSDYGCGWLPDMPADVATWLRPILAGSWVDHRLELTPDQIAFVRGYVGKLPTAKREYPPGFMYPNPDPADAREFLESVLEFNVALPKGHDRPTEAAGRGSKRKGTGARRGRKPATDDAINEACKAWIEYQRSGLGPKEFCERRNGDKKVGRVGVKWLNAKLALVRKLLRESPDRIPKRFANKIKPLRRVKRAV